MQRALVSAAAAGLAAAALAGCGGRTSTAAHRAAARYLVIARAGNSRLEHDFDPLEDRDIRLGAARADLRDAAATERLFDRRLLRIGFPAKEERVGRQLHRINQNRARLTLVVAASSSLRRLQTYEVWLDAANAPVERAVDTLRRQLGLPAADTS
jgi:hypothetical protein